jgi:DNA-binding response OmpR family regulator
MLARPAFIVAEPEPEQAISARKLLLETFKFNVITAHSVHETLEIVRLFPNANALIVHCRLPNFDSAEAIKTVRKTLPKLPVIALTPTDSELKWADYVVHSHHPQELLALVQRLFGDPRREFEGPEGSADPGE